MTTTVVAACQFTHGEFPVRSDGGPDAPPDAGMCSTVSTECIGDTLRTCATAGGSAVDTPCGWGCVMQMPHCAQLIPSGSGGVASNGVTPTDVTGDGLADVTLTDGFVIDTDIGRIGTAANPSMLHSGNVGTENGVDFEYRGTISMFRFKQLTISGTVTLIGKRPVALVSDGPVVIMGILDARGICSPPNPGPGGYAGGGSAGSDGSGPTTTTGGGSGASAASTGGGGGGHGTAGGDAKSVMGGAPFGDVAISALLGGGGGGAGEGGGNFGKGGGGGGAVQIISNTRIAVSSGGINAGGCGGKAGTGNSDSGGGGGAGGAILLEAPTVTVTAALAANGGGGGGGGGPAAAAGTNGTLDTVPAPGGMGQGGEPNEEGGAGGAAGAAPGPGGSGTNPGGGGGAIGRIRINTRGGSGATVTGATLSPGMSDPTFSTGSAATQ